MSEVRLISIEWERENEVKKVLLAKSPIEPSSAELGLYEYDIVLYNKIDDDYYQFAIQSKATPLLVSADGQRTPLFNVYENYWVIKGDWRTGQRGISYHHCPSINTAGKIHLEIPNEENHQRIVLDINSSIEDFDFEMLKSDFEGELWQLITADHSKVNTERREVRHGNRVLRFPSSLAIIDFLKAYDVIEAAPKHELKATKAEIDYHRVRPIPETLRKLSRGGSSRTLPSRATNDNIDIYENRLAAYMLASVRSIVSNNVRFSAIHEERLGVELSALTEKITVLEDSEPKVDEEAILANLHEEERQHEAWTASWKAEAQNFASRYTSTGENRQLIEVTARYNGISSEGWCTLSLNGSSPRFAMISFERSSSSILFEPEATVTFRGTCVRDGSAGKHPSYSITSIASGSFQLTSHSKERILKKQRLNLEILKRNDWKQTSLLNTREENDFQEQRIRQLDFIKSRSEMMAEQKINLAQLVEEQEYILPLIEGRMNRPFFRSIKMKAYTGFRPSMTFIQTISYRNLLNSFQTILTSEGIEMDLFDQYESAIDYGIREMPQIYELWCLVQLIKVLTDHYSFELKREDLKRLLRMISSDRKRIDDHVVLNFNNSLAGRKVTLHYQKKMSDGKRPDFVLEINSNQNSVAITLDSKFKNYNYKASILYELSNLRSKYSSVGPNCFILHPCNDGMFENRRIKYTNYGGEKIYFTHEDTVMVEFPIHKYGFINLKPGREDNLKKLLASALQYSIESVPIAEDKDPVPDHDVFCINCCSTDMNRTDYQYRSGGKYYDYNCSNSSCAHRLYLSYCWNCKARLFKHGPYWDYHLESSWSTFDIKCPNCGMTVADRPNQ